MIFNLIASEIMSLLLYVQEQRVIPDQEDHLEKMVKMEKEVLKAPQECQ
jgi:hypothetical protein